MSFHPPHVLNIGCQMCYHHHHHRHHWCGFWKYYFRQAGAMGENQTPGSLMQLRVFFSVSTIRSLHVSVLILDRDKQHLDLLQVWFTEGDFLSLPYIYVACNGFQFAYYEITLIDNVARWRLGWGLPQLSPLRSIYLSSCILYHLIKNVFKLVCCSRCSVALATKFSHKY